MSVNHFDRAVEAEWDPYWAYEGNEARDSQNASSMPSLSSSYVHQPARTGLRFSPISMPPTDEQVREAGGFQTPSLSSMVEQEGQDGGLMSSSGPSVSSLELPHPRYNRSQLESVSRRRRPLVRNDEISGAESMEQSGSFAVETGPATRGGQEPSGETGALGLQQDSEWTTEISWTQEEILEAAELEKEADAAYFAQMRALRTSDWVEYTKGIRYPFTPFCQIQSSEYVEGARSNNGFSGFSPVENGDEESWDDESRMNDDPFATPPDQMFFPPRSLLDPPVDHPFGSGYAFAKMAEGIDPQLSPCAYRGRGQANLLFDALQHEIRMNEEPHKRDFQQPEVDSERLSRYFEGSYAGDIMHGTAVLSDKSQVSGLTNLLDDF